MRTPTTSPAPGYVLHRKGDAFSRSTEILIPHAVHRELEDEENQRQAALLEAELLGEGKQSDGGVAGVLPETSSRPAHMPVTANTTQSGLQVILDKEEAVWREIEASDAKNLAHGTYPVFQSRQALALFKAAHAGDSEEKDRLKHIYQELVRRGSTRRLLKQPVCLKPLQALAQRQPHFKDVVHYVIQQLNLSLKSSQVLRLQPMLLVGEPGIGKTYFVQSLARALETSIYIQPLDSDLTNSLFLGSDVKWSNTKHGLIAELLLLGESANPVVVLDELDKCHSGFRYTSPLSSLHTLLEPVSAGAVRDISLLFELDASKITWIATANSVTHLEAALRSRFKEFHIMPPDAAGCLMLAEDVMRSAIESAGVDGFSTDTSLRRHVAHMTARQIWHCTREAMSVAVVNGRMHMVAEDLPAWVLCSAGGEPRKSAPLLH